ncbi:hypothetical protein [Bifidobacterium myosotis]|uniref:Uncharacterized protein n=1 Tax=Bifidobacterium myosotis TaxID=1630166 RepID=A0A5M9ZKJ4_9BIFI|nr:hypothetical protein [Bifidobacterium myosotis]KAA8828147.1 hypothetical protein EMO91_06820 [Bifidobacterium myosotis]
MVMDRNNMSHAPAGTPGGGRFDGKGAGAGADDVEPPAGPTGATAVVVRAIRADPDVSEWADRTGRLLDELTAGPAGDDADTGLLVAAIAFDPDGPGGSRSDYIADHVRDALTRSPLRARDRTALETRVRDDIMRTAVHPIEELRRLGLTAGDGERPARPDPSYRPRTFADDRDIARGRAAARGAATRRARRDAVMAAHLAPLDDRMRARFERDVTPASAVGATPLEDAAAYADALAELASRGWDPEAGAAWRRTAGFRRLERELLAGRRPTPAYRRLRDAIGDDPDSYRRLMASGDGMLASDARVMKPFAGLRAGGQTAMLRLAFEHRGTAGALALLRRDPSIEYTVGDPRTHTFRAEHDAVVPDLADDGTVIGSRHTMIGANGIRPASVMAWIHREEPGSPAWEARARERFAGAHGGDWRPAD